MIILAIDTATPFISLAIQTPKIIKSKNLLVNRAHAECITMHTEEIFIENHLRFKADKIIIGIGPGSYTGVRIAASYAQALKKVWQAEFYGISTLYLLLEDKSKDQILCLDANRGFYYITTHINNNINKIIIEEEIEKLSEKSINLNYKIFKISKDNLITISQKFNIMINQNNPNAENLLYLEEFYTKNPQDNLIYL